jgi:hypothetical protein
MISSIPTLLKNDTPYFLLCQLPVLPPFLFPFILRSRLKTLPPLAYQQAGGGTERKNEGNERLIFNLVRSKLKYVKRRRVKTIHKFINRHLGQPRRNDSDE